jgi:hypothetical protein
MRNRCIGNEAEKEPSEAILCENIVVEADKGEYVSDRNFEP